MLIFASPLFSHSQEREREGDIYVNEVIIKNKGLIDFIRERVFKVVDSLIVPQTPYIRYIIQFEKKHGSKHTIIMSQLGLMVNRGDFMIMDMINP